MKPEQKVLRLGSILIIGAILLRLLGSNPMTAAGVARLVIFMQTGRLVSAEGPAVEITAPTEAVSVTVHTPQPVSVSFSAEDAELVKVINTTSYQVDMEALLTKALDWKLCSDEPTVLILHAHATESYAGTKNYRSEEESENMLSIGDRLEALLENAGIGVIHDRTLHDAPSYNGSYASARTSMKEYLEKYPSIRLVLDLHRDAAEDAQGNQKYIQGLTVECAEDSTAYWYCEGKDGITASTYVQEFTVTFLDWDDYVLSTRFHSQHSIRHDWSLPRFSD